MKQEISIYYERSMKKLLPYNRYKPIESNEICIEILSSELIKLANFKFIWKYLIGKKSSHTKSLNVR